MRIITDISTLRKTLAHARARGKTVGFVPTMGYLHEGHAALMRQAKMEHDVCVVSIYVNPTQFGPTEDFKKYPRDIRRDSSVAKKEKVDIIFLPSDNTVYPQGYLTYIDVENLSSVLCGAYRPGHFRGVATVVARMLGMVRPDALYLGSKDAQQVAVISTMLRDLDVPVQVRVVPTVREPDGLAMSSRNVYLSPQQRREAKVLYQALQEAKTGIRAGERKASRVVSGIRRKIAGQTSGKIQYVACVQWPTLKPLTKLQDQVLIALAVCFGKTRLIDNVIVRLSSRKV
jgi:pantoate--beta-alanine ligase